MNVENMQKVITALREIDKSPISNKQFNIEQWGDYGHYDTEDIESIRENPNHCYTPGCIAGWTFLLCADNQQQNDHVRHNFSVRSIATRLLDLPQGQANHLFIGFDTTQYDVTPARAAEVLEYLLMHPNSMDAWQQVSANWPKKPERTTTK